MANQDLNRLFQNLHQAREVFVTEDGQLEDAATAERNAQAEQNGAAPPKERTRLKSEVWGARALRPVVRATLSALNAMHEEVAQHPGESGGLLVGPDPFTVSEFIPSGPDANRTSGSYEFDVAYLQPRLDEAQDRGLVFVGVFHSHPEECRKLSSIDLATARSIVGDPEWCVRSLVLPLAVRYRGGFETTFYVFSKHLPRPVEAELRLLAETPTAPSKSQLATAATASEKTKDVPEAHAIGSTAAKVAPAPRLPSRARRLVGRFVTRPRSVRFGLLRFLRGVR